MYKRILLKLSGEALKEKGGKHIIDVDNMEIMAEVIKSLHESGVEIAVVVGAGNIWRGKVASKIGIDPIPADFMGMLGTVINGVALASNLNKIGVPSIVYSAVPAIEGVTEAYDKSKALESLVSGKVVFLTGGTGKPFFTTDTAASLRAIELHCEAILMGKNGVNGVYTSDPTIDPNAKFIKNITFKEMLEQKLAIMDISAVELLKDSSIDVRIFSMEDPNNFMKVAHGDDMGTTLTKGE